MCLRIYAGFTGDSFRETHLWEHFGRTDRIALITCLEQSNVSGAFPTEWRLLCSFGASWNLPCGNGRQLQAQKEQITYLNQNRLKETFSSFAKRLKSDQRATFEPQEPLLSHLGVKKSLFGRFWVSFAERGQSLLKTLFSARYYIFFLVCSCPLFPQCLPFGLQRLNHNTSSSCLSVLMRKHLNKKCSHSQGLGRTRRGLRRRVVARRPWCWFTILCKSVCTAFPNSVVSSDASSYCWSPAWAELDTCEKKTGLKHLKLGRNADNSGREFGGGEGAAETQERNRAEKIAEKIRRRIRWEICGQFSPNSPDRNKRFNPYPLCRTLGSILGGQEGCRATKWRELTLFLRS